MFKHLLVVLSLAFTTAALAASAVCTTAAAEKKLTGATKTAFLKKCEVDAKAKIELVSKQKNFSVAPTSTFAHQCEHGSDL